MGKRRNPNNPPKDHQFKPGQSGNPGGVAGGKKVSTWLIELGQLAELAAYSKPLEPETPNAAA